MNQLFNPLSVIFCPAPQIHLRLGCWVIWNLSKLTLI